MNLKPIVKYKKKNYFQENEVSMKIIRLALSRIEPIVFLLFVRLKRDNQQIVVQIRYVFDLVSNKSTNQSYSSCKNMIYMNPIDLIVWYLITLP